MTFPVPRRGGRVLSSLGRSQWRWTARLAAPVNAMSTLVRPTTANGRLRAPTSRTAPAVVSRTNVAGRQPVRTLTVPLITRRSQVQILPPPPIAPGQRPFPLRRGGPRLLPGVNALSTRLGVGAHGHPCAVVGARAIGSVLVTRRSAGTAAHENRREHAGAVFCLDHLGHNPKVLPAQRCRHVRVPALVRRDDTTSVVG